MATHFRRQLGGSDDSPHRPLEEEEEKVEVVVEESKVEVQKMQRRDSKLVTAPKTKKSPPVT